MIFARKKDEQNAQYEASAFPGILLHYNDRFTLTEVFSNF